MFVGEHNVYKQWTSSNITQQMTSPTNIRLEGAICSRRPDGPDAASPRVRGETAKIIHYVWIWLVIVDYGWLLVIINISNNDNNIMIVGDNNQ